MMTKNKDRNRLRKHRDPDYRRAKQQSTTPHAGGQAGQLVPRCNNKNCPRPRGAMRDFCSHCWANLPERYRLEILRAGATETERAQAIAAATRVLARFPAPRVLASRA